MTGFEAHPIKAISPEFCQDMATNNENSQSQFFKEHIPRIPFF
jgi:hypothetical protein